MGLFYNNNVAGKGVAKNGPKKKPFFRFWEMFFRKFWTLFQLNLIYVLFCLPIVTFGPATAALTAMIRNIYLERPQFIWHDFVANFKKCFKKSIVVGILDIALFVVLAITLIQFSGQPDLESDRKALYYISIVIQMVLFMMNFYIYPQIVGLDIPLSGIFRNSLIMVFSNLPAELIMAAVTVGFVALFMFFTFPMLFLLPFLPGAWLVFLSVFTCYPAIQKHIIIPYYEQSGERNPEIPDWELEDEEEDDAVFEDQGGNEEPIDLRKEKNKGGKVIK